MEHHGSSRPHEHIHPRLNKRSYMYTKSPWAPWPSPINPTSINSRHRHIHASRRAQRGTNPFNPLNPLQFNPLPLHVLRRRCDRGDHSTDAPGASPHPRTPRTAADAKGVPDGLRPRTLGSNSETRIPVTRTQIFRVLSQLGETADGAATDGTV